MAEQELLPTLSFSITVDGQEAGTQEFEQEMVTIGKGGAANAGIFAAQIIARKDPEVASKLVRFKEELAAGVEAKDRKLQDSLKG